MVSLRARLRKHSAAFSQQLPFRIIEAQATNHTRRTMQLTWIEPESRFLIKTLFRRNFDTFTQSAQRTTNWMVLGLDILLIWMIF